MQFREMPEDDPLFQTEKFRMWVEEADEILRRDWFISIVDAGIENYRMYQAMHEGESPAEYIAWFAEKYDLYDFKTGYG